jgi:tripartite tricarboxylate transporter TctB family protein
MSGDADNRATVSHETGRVLFPAVNTRQGALWIAAVLAVTGAVFASQTLLLDFGTLALPGPGLIPLVLAVLTVVLAGFIGFAEWRRPDSGETIELGHRDVLIVFVALLAVPSLFQPLGADATLGLFGAVLLVFVARTSVVIAAAAAVVGMTACWYFFEVALGLQLPVGWVWEGIWEWFTQANG